MVKLLVAFLPFIIPLYTLLHVGPIGSITAPGLGHILLDDVRTGYSIRRARVPAFDVIFISCFIFNFIF